MTIGGCVSDIGAVRTINQDTVLYKSLEQSGLRFVLGIVCDGIGGLEHSELASKCVCQAAEQWFDEVAQWIEIETMQQDILYAHFKDATEQWNRLVRSIGAQQRLTMGTTMSAIMILRNHYFIIHAGDSRVYKYQKHLQQLTLDESTAKIKGGRMQLYLNNYVGKQDELCYLEYQGTVEAGDIFLYGSDGLCHYLLEKDIEAVSREIWIKGAEKMCRELIYQMILRGERDNISAGIIACGSSSR